MRNTLIVLVLMSLICACSAPKSNDTQINLNAIDTLRAWQMRKFQDSVILVTVITNRDKYFTNPLTDRLDKVAERNFQDAWICDYEAVKEQIAIYEQKKIRQATQKSNS